MGTAKFFCFNCGVDVLFSNDHDASVSCGCDFVLNLDHMMLEPEDDDVIHSILCFPDNQALLVDGGDRVMLFQDETLVYSLVHDDDTLS